MTSRSSPRRCHRSRGPRYRRYTEDGQPTEAFLAAEAAAPRASREITEWSGVPDSMAPGPIGKLIVGSLVPGLVRPEALMGMLRVGMVVDAPVGARVQVERNGAGRPFYRLVWRGSPGPNGKRPLNRMYLTTNAVLGRWAEEVMQEKRWTATQLAPRALPTERIRRLQALLQRAHEAGKRVSTSTPFRFHGFALAEARS